MLPRELLRQIRRLHLRAKRAVEDVLAGHYRSVFKGSGIAFEEVREYQPGDDIRAIDWNVTARTGQPFIKRFVEERELTVVLVVDVSGSLQFGTQAQLKREVLAELAAVLAFSALANKDKVGLLLCTEQIELYLPPRKGSRHALRLIREVLVHQPMGQATSLQTALAYLNKVLHRRAIVFLLSDFLDRGFDKALKQTARRHDLIALRTTDPREESLPNVGFVDCYDPETGARQLLDTGSRQVRDAYAQAARARRDSFVQLARSAQVDLVEVSTDGGHVDALVRFFQLRERRLRRG